MKKKIILFFVMAFAVISVANAQTRELQIYQGGSIVQSLLINNIDSIKIVEIDNNDNGGNGNDDNYDDNGDGTIPSALVGLWAQRLDYAGNPDAYHGIYIKADGKACFNEWDVEEAPDFIDMVYGDVKISGNTMRVTHPRCHGYFELYKYELSADGKSLTLTLLDYDEGEGGAFIGFNGTFTKYEGYIIEDK